MTTIAQAHDTDFGLWNIDTARDYATEENLFKALAKYGLDEFRFMVVCNRKGRFTAIFTAGQFDGNVTLAAGFGFKTIGM